MTDIQKQLRDAWLNIDIEDKYLFNPMTNIPEGLEDEPHLYFMWLLQQPEYFHLVCRYILNVDLLPVQAVMLKEMWHRKFPMMIASRGFGKSFMLGLYALLRILLLPRRRVMICGAAFRQSKVIFNYMESIYSNAPILRDILGTGRENGPKHEPDMFKFYIGDSMASAIPLGDGSKIRGQRANDVLMDEFACLDGDSLVETNNGLVRIRDFDSVDHVITGDKKIIYERPTKFIRTPLTGAYKIKLDNGYVIRCSIDHQLMTHKGWKKVSNLKVGDYIEKSSQSICCNKNQIVNLDEKMAWLLGILVSEGSVTHKNQISVNTTDKNICKRLVNDYGFKINIKEKYIDKRGWNCKQLFCLWKCDQDLRKQLYNFGLDCVKSHDKKIPWAILQSPKNIIQSFLSGLFDGDGSCFLWKDKNFDNRLGLAYYSVSERLCRDVQILMYKLGYDGYISNRKSNISDNAQWFVRWNNNIAYKACEFLNVSRFHNILEQCSLPDKPKNICWNKQHNKWKVAYQYLGKTIQKNFKNINDAENFLNKLKHKTQYRKIVSIEQDGMDHLYDYYLPQTHSFYAEGFRQHNSVSREIFENVIAGFAAVSSSPVEGVKRKAMERRAKELGVKLEEEKNIIDTNQIIISGTAYYDFNHFGEYWKRWREIIRSKGNKERLEEIFGDEEIPEDFDWKDYSIIRIPFGLVPKGFMDDAMVARSKATVHSGIYLMEFGSCFSNDSNGFFKRSLIESCVCRPNNPIILPSGPVEFSLALHGSPDKKYIFGVDPASEVDNFSIVVLELHKDHRRIVYSWTTNRKEHRARLKTGLVDEDDFYSYCARKIRDLMVKFPCVRIMIDSQGGGVAVTEALHDKDKLKEGELKIWPVIDPKKPQESDGESGLHIVEMCNFSSSDWTSEANHGLRKDFEDKVCLFPFFDSVALELASVDDDREKRIYDTLEDCYLEIEELKNELSMIIITQTMTGRDRWDTPEVKLPGNKKGRLRKDRYSALVMANMGARELMRNPTKPLVTSTGGFAMSGQKAKSDGVEYYGPSWFVEGMRGIYD